MALLAGAGAEALHNPHKTQHLLLD